MGRDKADVTLAGVPLWRRQLATLRETGPAELFISGRPDGPYHNVGCEVVFDEKSGLGPLGGVTAALRRARYDQVLILAIDLARMPSMFLTKLLQEAAQLDRGIVPRLKGRFEPLAAVYSRACLAFAEAQLQTANRSMQRFVRTAIGAKLLDEYPLSEDESRYFLNLNTQADWHAASEDLTARLDR
jgi:molybdopterin-guanine dinucleotide biosynthesis protein A